MSTIATLAEPKVMHSYQAPAKVLTLAPHVREHVQIGTLYAAGDVSLLHRPAVAIVGSRKASDHGRSLAGEVARELVALGYVVLSGLAAGIDTAAHRAAMAADGRTIAVIGTPLDRAYPWENSRLQERIYQDHLLLSPFAAGTVTKRGHFPARNRVMARMSKATVLVEAGERSGTVHQVKEALAVGRPVLVSERLMMDPRVQWPRQLWGLPGVFVWATAADVREFIRESFGSAAVGEQTRGHLPLSP